MNTFTKILSFFSVIALITVISIKPLKAQFKDGAWGFSAGIAMPSGITTSAGLPSLTSVAFTYGASTSLLYLVSQALQLELGLGIASQSFTVATGSAPNSQTSISFSFGGKYFLMTKDVMPYITAGFSYTGFPKTTVTGTDYTGSLVTFLAGFGAESFLNSTRTIGLFIQIGIGFNSITNTVTVAGQSASSGSSTFNLGG
jgi:hypothetical protein